MSKIIRNLTEDELTFVSGAALAEEVRGAFDHDEKMRTIGLLNGPIEGLLDVYEGQT